MKGALAILGLVACATAFQYSIPQYGAFSGRQYQRLGDNVLSGIHSSYQGPYNNQYYQQKFGGRYQGSNDQEYQKHTDYNQYKGEDVYQQDVDRYEGNHNNQEGNQGYYDLYKKLYNKYYKGAYNKYFGKIQDYLKNYQGEDSSEYQGVYDQQSVEDQYKYGQVSGNKYQAKKQQDVYQLLKYINSQIYDNEYQEIYKNFEVEKYSQYYQTEAYKNFKHLWENQMFLPKGEIFSIFNDIHVKQVKALFGLFFTAKDYETFYKTAVWARKNINEGMFLYTFSVAVAHRPDTQGIVLPAIYEIYPQYFFNSEVMQKAYQHKMSHFSNKQAGQNGYYTIRANYSGSYLNLNPEQSLSYYLEDVGMNACYYYINIYYPYWLESQDHQTIVNRGEFFYYLHQQLVAKYYLERLSHGVGGIDFFNWEVPFETGYYPSLTYPNGLTFAERPNFANLQEYFQNYGQRWCFVSKYGYGYTYVNTYEQRIREAIDLGYVYTYDGKKIDLYTREGINVLGNIMEGNADSPNNRYYGSYVNFARHLLGYAKQPLDNYKLAPSALEHYETSLRDPAFYKLFKKVTLLFQKYISQLPAYTKNDLYYPGVKVEQVEVEPLVTFYDKFYADITNGLTVTPEEYETDSTFRVQVQQYRLNHKTFNYKVYVNSDKTTKATVKVFMGPKYDEHGRVINFYENRMNFVELDHFVYTLKSGQNKIVRNSRDFTGYAMDKTSVFDMYKNVMKYNEENMYQINELPYGAPQRLILPRGSEEGQTFQFYVIVFPYVQRQSHQSNNYYQTKKYQYYGQDLDSKYNQGEQSYNNYETKYDDLNTKYNKYDQLEKIMMNNYPMGYPFDRPAEFENVYYVPNSYIKAVKVYHKILKTEDEEAKSYSNQKSLIV